MIGRWIVAIALISMAFTVAEAQFTGKISRESPDLVSDHKVRLPAGTAGVDIGVPLAISFPDGHDFLVGEIVDLHWNEPSDDSPGKHRVTRGLTVDDVLPTLIDFTGGEADSGPSRQVLSPVVVSRQTIVTLTPTVVAFDIVHISAGCTRQGVIDFRSVFNQSMHYEKMERKSSGFFWTEDFHHTNPIGTGFQQMRFIVMSNGTTRFVDFFYIIQTG